MLSGGHGSDARPAAIDGASRVILAEIPAAVNPIRKKRSKSVTARKHADLSGFSTREKVGEDD
jgi:hypothetical protein